MSDGKNPTRVAAGLKATLHNPNVSEDAKHAAHERLEQMGAVDREPVARSTGASSNAERHEHHVLGGYKAALHNDNVSDEAKAHAREILVASGYERGPEVGEDEHQRRVLAGYKAALHNPKVSEGAKAHAAEYLRAHNAL